MRCAFFLKYFELAFYIPSNLVFFLQGFNTFLLFCLFMAVFFLPSSILCPRSLSAFAAFVALFCFWRQSRRPKPCRCTALHGLAQPPLDIFKDDEAEKNRTNDYSCDFVFLTRSIFSLFSHFSISPLAPVKGAECRPRNAPA